jgi:large subunit ribosomal protein L22
MTCFKLVKYIPRKVPTDRVLKFECVFKSQKRVCMSVFKVQRVLDNIRWCYYENFLFLFVEMKRRKSGFLVTGCKIQNKLEPLTRILSKKRSCGSEQLLNRYSVSPSSYCHTIK